MCNPWNHRDPVGFALFFSIAGGQSHVAVDCPTKRAAMWLISGRDAFWTYLLGCGVDKLSLQSSRKGLMSSADVHATSSPCRSLDRCFLLELMDLYFLSRSPYLYS